MSQLEGAPPGQEVASLHLAESNALLSAWIQSVADSVGVRVLLVKGATLQHHGLRRAQDSSDVDVLVEPSGFYVLCNAVAESGWEAFPHTFASDHLPNHSAVYRKDNWPSSLDLHNHFPGFLKHPALVFDQLWQRRVPVDVAHQPCSYPDFSSCFLIMALHGSRTETVESRAEQELAALRELPLTEQQLGDIGALAHSTGASAAIPAFLKSVGVVVATQVDNADVPAQLAWQRRVIGAQNPATAWLLLLKSTPPRERAAVIRHAIWPTRADFHDTRPEVPDRFWPIFAGRVGRLGYGLRKLPAAAVLAVRRPPAPDAEVPPSS